MYRRLLAILLFLMPIATTVHAQSDKADVFVPISKYIEKGDAESLSAWFADNFELSILGNVNECSRNQGRLILKRFFLQNSPKEFEIVHKSGAAPMKYAVGILSAGGDSYMITLLVKTQNSGNYIQHFRITRNNN